MYIYINIHLLCLRLERIDSIHLCYSVCLTVVPTSIIQHLSSFPSIFAVKKQTWQEIHFSSVPLCAEPLYTLRFWQENDYLVIPKWKETTRPSKNNLNKTKTTISLNTQGLFVHYRPKKRASEHPISITGSCVFDPLNRSMLPWFVARLVLETLSSTSTENVTFWSEWFVIISLDSSRNTQNSSKRSHTAIGKRPIFQGWTVSFRESKYWKPH